MLLKNKRIFVIEDNPAYLSIISIYLKPEGAEIIPERWGIDVPQLILEAMPVDMILLDLKLYRNIDGFTIYDEIRQIPELADIPVVAVSSVDPDQAIHTAREKGFAGFIGKPLSRRLAKHLHDILNGKELWLPGALDTP